MNIRNQLLLALNLIKGIGPKVIMSLAHHEEFEALMTFSAYDLHHRFGLTQHAAQLVLEGLADRKAFEKECVGLEKSGIKLLTILDDAYPSALKNIHLPPPVLYVQGTFAPAQPLLALVGSRKAGRYGHDVTVHFAQGLVACGFATVSGGALGIDTMVHRATLDAQGTTFAVLGSGLLRPYPSENKALFSEICSSGGALISPFSLYTEPFPGNFPARNRIISGMSQGCLVIAAALKSGAAITAHYALEQGRHVFVVPGSIFDELSAGCHALARQGASLVTSVGDVVEELGFKRTEFDSSVFSAQAHDEVPVEHSENPLVAALAQPHTIDELCARLKRSLDEIQTELVMLNLEGKVKQNFAGLWERI
jgi:DNA processing protein